MLCKKSLIKQKVTILILFNTVLLLYLTCKSPVEVVSKTINCDSHCPSRSIDVDVSRHNKYSFNASYHDKRLLIFNRVPKTGSTMMVKKLDELKAENGFFRGHIASAGKILPNEVQNRIIADMEKNLRKDKRKKAAFSGHLYFIDFDNEEQVWFSIIRDPVEKFISAFCYNRENHFEAGWLAGIKWNIPKGVSKEEFARKNLETCIQQRDLECQIIQGEPYDYSIVSIVPQYMQ